MKTAFMLAIGIVLMVWLVCILWKAYAEEPVNLKEDMKMSEYLTLIKYHKIKYVYCSSWSQGFLKEQSCKV